MSSVGFVQPSFMAIILTLDIIRSNFSIKTCCSCHALRHHRLFPFYTTYSDLDLGLRSDQCKAKVVDFILFHPFQLIWMVPKQRKIRIPILLANDIHCTKGNNFCSTDCVKSKQRNEQTFGCLRADCFKLGMLLDFFVLFCFCLHSTF